jgi:hypothetical protein
MKIKEALQSLPEDKRKNIMEAFNNENTLTVELLEGLVLGVNVFNFEGLEILDQQGGWTVAKKL